MKKKIIYFCAGVLLTSLVLVAIQVVATAPNPGHDENSLSILGKTPLRTFSVAAENRLMNINPPGSCNTLCALTTSTCYAACDTTNGCIVSAYYCGQTTISLDVSNCMCTYPAHYEVWWH